MLNKKQAEKIIEELSCNDELYGYECLYRPLGNIILEKKFKNIYIVIYKNTKENLYGILNIVEGCCDGCDIMLNILAESDDPEDDFADLILVLQEKIDWVNQQDFYNYITDPKNLKDLKKTELEELIEDCKKVIQ